jgi:hypothetical protein
MGVDPETGLYMHQFYQVSQEEEEYESEDEGIENRRNLCIICRDVREKHNDPHKNAEGAPMGVFNNKVQNTTMFENSNNNLVKNDEYAQMAKETDIIQKLNTKVQINQEYIEKLEIEFRDKTNLCIICYSEEITEQNSHTFPCNHSFCKSCVKNYLLNMVSDGKVEKVYCLQAGCKNLLPDRVIKEELSRENYLKFVKFKKRNTLMANIHRGMIPCTHPDCEEWVKYKEGEDPFVECEQEHKFCAKCKEGWHKKNKCKNKNLEALKKNSKIKTCPNCGNFIEKIDGCNHITCSMCTHEFCWLCLRKYNYYHYYVFNPQGCPGMKFGKKIYLHIF